MTMKKLQVTWKPYPGAQEEFLSRSEFEVLYGGQAGPGMTDCLRPFSVEEKKIELKIATREAVGRVWGEE